MTGDRPVDEAGSGSAGTRPLPGDRVAYSPIIDRPPIRWPGDARVAFWVAPNVEFYEYLPPRDGVRNPWPRSPHPDVRGYAEREYGNRVGFWRMLPVLDRYDIRCTVSLNFAVLDHFPEIAEAMTSRPWELMSHGIYNTRYLTTLSEDDEQGKWSRTQFGMMFTEANALARVGNVQEGTKRSLARKSPPPPPWRRFSGHRESGRSARRCPIRRA